MDSLSFDVPIVATRDKGVNKISVCIDADNAVDEIYESNNCITKDVVIYEDEARPVFPYNYAIVNNPSQNYLLLLPIHSAMESSIIWKLIQLSFSIHL
jgi:hypothetical protein